MNDRGRLIVAVLLLGLCFAWACGPAWAADTDGETGPMPGMEHGTMGHSGMDHGDHQAMPGMDHGAMQGGSAPPEARDPHAYSGGYDFGPIPRPRMGDEELFGSLLVDRCEAGLSRHTSSLAYELTAWFGRDYERAVLKAEGEREGGEARDTHADLLWGHAMDAFWDIQLGARLDSGPGPDRNWLAIGVQGLAPYWFEIDIAAYLGEEGRSLLRLESEYELLLTQRIVLQPRIEANILGKSDPERMLGSGLSDLNLGLRLRYEIRREFAPYLGIEWAAKFGATADYARENGEEARETKLVVGLRFWY